MKPKIIWRVEPAPTGRFRSFQRRGWPSATHDTTDGPIAARLTCKDEYVPHRVREGKHSEITVYLYLDGRREPQPLRKRAATLDEAKKLVSGFFEKYPHTKRGA